MNIGRTANPALNKNTFSGFSMSHSEIGAMTIQGTVNKVFLMLILLGASAWYVWNKFFEANGVEGAVFNVQPYIIFGTIGGFIMAILTVFKKPWSGITAPIYAVFEGLFLGGISAYVEMVTKEGIVLQAVSLTLLTLFALLIAYKTRIIKVTANFKLGVFAATGAIALVYLLSFILSFFGINFGFINNSGPIGIGISLFIVVIAALNLVLDFDFIEQGAENGAPKYMEWYAAFGLMVTLVWLYLEILRLLAKLNSRK